MENQIEHQVFSIGSPAKGDEILIGKVHLQAGKETYLNPDNGVTEELINELMGHVATEKGDEYRRDTFAKMLAHPDQILYRVVKDGSNNVVGFMHCTKDTDENELGSIYLLNDAKGKGLGDKLMNEFLRWADKDKLSYLRVFTMNTRAIKFYEKYGFKKVEDSESLYKGLIPDFEMVRLVEKTD